MAASPQALHGFVTGLVQGVYFRAATQKMALELGILGWVRNTDDGRVEVLLQGSPEALADMRVWLQRGPQHARVENVQLGDVAPQAFKDFSIRS